MKESDWKLLSTLRPLAVERLYDHILQDVQKAVNAEGKTSRELIHATKQAVDSGIKDVRDVFDSLNFSRTHAEMHLMSMCRSELLTEEEVAGFSDEVRLKAVRWLAPDAE